MSHSKTASPRTVEEAKPEPPVDNPYWRQELEELDRYFPRPTPAEAQQCADEELHKHDAIINKLETRLAQLKTAMGEPYVNGREKQNIARTIEETESELVEAKRLRQRSINLCGAGIRSAKECEPKRARWMELTARSKRVENLTAKVKRGGW